MTKELLLAEAMGVSNLKIHGDSQLLVNQINVVFQAKDSMMEAYLYKMKEVLARFKEKQVLACVVRILREEDSETDLLNKMVITQMESLLQ